MVVGWVSNAKEHDVEPTVSIIVGVLGLTSIAGGIYLLRRAAETGDTFKRSLAMAPFIVLVLLMAIGGIAIVTHSVEPSPPTDAYGYTEVEHRAFLNGCGGGQRCECLWSEVEQSVTPDQMHEATRQYESTGTYPPEVERAIFAAATSCL
jgi:hypothetical protein